MSKTKNETNQLDKIQNNAEELELKIQDSLMPACNYLLDEINELEKNGIIDNTARLEIRGKINLAFRDVWANQRSTIQSILGYEQAQIVNKQAKKYNEDKEEVEKMNA